MIVVADSGPLHYLILLDHADLLRRFYGRVAVPDAVAAELISPGVLRAGAEQGLVNVPDLVARLPSTSFYVDERSCRWSSGRG